MGTVLNFERIGKTKSNKSDIPDLFKEYQYKGITIIGRVYYCGAHIHNEWVARGPARLIVPSAILRSMSFIGPDKEVNSILLNEELRPLTIKLMARSKVFFAIFSRLWKYRAERSYRKIAKIVRLNNTISENIGDSLDQIRKMGTEEKS